MSTSVAIAEKVTPEELANIMETFDVSFGMATVGYALFNPDKKVFPDEVLEVIEREQLTIDDLIEFENQMFAKHATKKADNVVDAMARQNAGYRYFKNRYRSIPDTQHLSIHGKADQRVRAVCGNGEYTLYEVQTVYNQTLDKGLPVKSSLYFVHEEKTEKVTPMGNKRMFGITGNEPREFPINEQGKVMELYPYAKTVEGIRSFVNTFYRSVEMDKHAAITRMSQIVEFAKQSIQWERVTPIIAKSTATRETLQAKLDSSVDESLPDFA